MQAKNGQTVATPGPYVAQPGGTVGGFLEFQAETDEEAVHLASQIPAVGQGGAVEFARPKSTGRQHCSMGGIAHRVRSRYPSRIAASIAGTARHRRDRAIAFRRQRRRDIGVAARVEGIASTQVLREESAIEHVAGTGRIDKLGLARLHVDAPILGRDDRALLAESQSDDLRVRSTGRNRQCDPDRRGR